jgi:hypothetical protein
MPNDKRTYDVLMQQIVRMQAEGKLPTKVTREQMVDWVYGNSAIENADVTREIVERAVDRRIGR